MSILSVYRAKSTVLFLIVLYCFFMLFTSRLMSTPETYVNCTDFRTTLTNSRIEVGAACVPREEE